MPSAVSASVPHSSSFVRKDRLKVANNDLAVALLLSQIVYWHEPGKNGKTKLRVRKKVDGQWHFFIAKARGEWMEECGLTIKQYRRAMKVLRERNLADFRIFLFNGKITPHVRLVVENYEDALAGRGQSIVPTTVQSIVPTGVQSIVPTWVQSSTVTTTETTTVISFCGKPATPGEKKLEKSVHSGKDIGEKPKTEKMKVMKAKTLDEVLEEKKQEKELKLANPSGQKSIQFMWKQHMAREFGKTVNGELMEITKRQAGQLKMFAKKIGPQANDVLAYTIKYWSKFANEAKNQKGAVNLPTTPTTDYLLKFWDVALELFVQSIANQAKLPAPPVAVPEQTQEQTQEQPAASPPAKKEKYVPSPEKFAELMAYFKEKSG